MATHVVHSGRRGATDLGQCFRLAASSVTASIATGTFMNPARERALENSHSKGSVAKPRRTGFDSMYKIAFRIASWSYRFRSNPPPGCQKRWDTPGAITPGRVALTPGQGLQYARLNSTTLCIRTRTSATVLLHF